MEEARSLDVLPNDATTDHVVDDDPFDSRRIDPIIQRCSPTRARQGRKPGAIRVELRGLRNNQFEVVVLGCLDRPSIAASTVLAVAVGDLIAGKYDSGSSGLASRVEPVSFLHELAHRGVKCARFEGAPSFL